MLVEIVGQVINIHREEIAGKVREGQDQKFWERMRYQLLTHYDGRAMELETLDVFGEKGKLEQDPRLVEARAKQQRVKILINVTVDQRMNNNPQLATKIVEVNPAYGSGLGGIALTPTNNGETGGSSVKPATVAGATK